MKKKGFTYLEVMIAISIFAILILAIMKLNITSENNLNSQITNQKMMFLAQKQLEKYKTTQPAGIIPVFTLIDGYYVKLTSDNTPGGNIYRVTVIVRKNPTNSTGELTLQCHVIKN
jgi:prepilin-type N-terminal cleavage/methylation domain-containing protein